MFRSKFISSVAISSISNQINGYDSLHIQKFIAKIYCFFEKTSTFSRNQYFFQGFFSIVGWMSLFDPDKMIRINVIVWFYKDTETRLISQYLSHVDKLVDISEGFILHIKDTPSRYQVSNSCILPCHYLQTQGMSARVYYTHWYEPIILQRDETSKAYISKYQAKYLVESSWLKLFGLYLKQL